MKLSTYNFLTSKAVKGVKVGFPLKLTVTKTECVEAEFDPIFIERLLPKLDWPALLSSAQLVDLADGIPAEPPTEVTEDLLKKLHHLLMEVEVMEGLMVCPETGRLFPIKDGVPNMLLTEGEV